MSLAASYSDQVLRSQHSELCRSLNSTNARTIPGWKYNELPKSLRNWTHTSASLERLMYDAIQRRTPVGDEARLAYRFFDRDRMGQITIDNLVHAYKEQDLVLSDELAQQIYDKYDMDGDGIVSMKDFVEYWHTIPTDFDHHNIQKFAAPKYKLDKEAQHERIGSVSMSKQTWNLGTLVAQIQQKILVRMKSKTRASRVAWAQFDTHGQGVIKANALRHTCENYGLTLDENELEALMEYFDADGDGVINWRDFCARVMPWDLPLLADNTVLEHSHDDASDVSYKRPLSQTESLICVSRVKHAEESIDGNLGFRKSWGGYTLSKPDLAHHATFTTRGRTRRSWLATSGSSEPYLDPETDKGVPFRINPYNGVPVKPPGQAQMEKQIRETGIVPPDDLYDGIVGPGLGMFANPDPRTTPATDLLKQARGLIPPRAAKSRSGDGALVSNTFDIGKYKHTKHNRTMNPSLNHSTSNVSLDAPFGLDDTADSSRFDRSGIGSRSSSRSNLDESLVQGAVPHQSSLSRSNTNNMLSTASLHESRAMHDEAPESVPNEDKRQLERELGQMNKYRNTWKKLQQERSLIESKQQPWIKPFKNRGESYVDKVNERTINPTKLRDNRGVMVPPAADEIVHKGHGAYGAMVPVMQLSHHRHKLPQPISHASSMQYLPDHL